MIIQYLMSKLIQETFADFKKKQMTSKEKLYEILSLSLIEIRGETNELLNEKTEQDEFKLKKIYAISHLVHNLPSVLNKDNVDFDKELSKIIETAEYNNKALADWLKSNLEIISKR